MGGCRCSYKNCERATKNSEREFHFFHYPVRDPERCLKWIANARKPRFLNLPEDQLRNKVICQNHFEDRYFTNANRKRLIHNAVPTLDTDCVEPKDEGMCNVQVLQSDADASVFTVDTNLLNIKEISEVRSFLIENGDVVPANLCQVPIVDHEVVEDVRVHECVTPIEVSNNNEYKVEEVSSNLPKNELPVKNETDPAKDIVAPRDDDILISEDLTNEVVKPVENVPQEKKRVKVKLPVLRNHSTDFELLTKAVEEHTKEIATLKRLLNMRIQRVKRKKQKEKMLVLGKLRRMLPPTLFSLINVHVFGKQENFTKEENRLLTSLFKASPSTYNILVNDYKWKLPSATIVRNLSLSCNNDR